ncbi:hypothetical protein BCR42DRAFT_87532 [Absidia repens]|uniref:Uncharacterized protein n=1 Tax=Absidia repens TaxID=90262 RepID=A0A1X2IY62_9FUNG|nr:hypothetical protein BCR42DRAFT_87532 [Absidia repens]
MYGLCVLSNYLFFLALVPMVAHCDYFRNYLLPRLAHLLHLSKVPVDQHLLAVSLVTFFVYFFLYLAMDVIQTINTLSSACRQRRVSTHARTTSTSTSTSITTKRTTTTQSISGYAPSLDGSQSTLSTCNISTGVNRAHQQLVHYYPGNQQNQLQKLGIM